MDYNEIAQNELFNNNDGNDDILSDIGGTDEVRHNMQAIKPYNVSDGNGVVNEVYDKNIADIVAKKVAEKYKLNTPNYIGGGENGVAYDIGNDKILKITSDKSEANENINLIGKPLEYIAHPYNVYVIKSNSDLSIPETYGIILEKLETAPEHFKRLFGRLRFAFKEILGIELSQAVDYFLFDEFTDKNDIEKIEKYLSKNPEDYEFFHGLLNIAEEANENNILSIDYYNYKNLGYKKNGNLAFFDVGFGEKDVTFNKQPEEIEIEEDGSSLYSTDNSIGQNDFPIYNQNDSSDLLDNNIETTTDGITERILSSMEGSSTVNVKKKCRLGGTGNTSVACNQGDIKNLEIKPLGELYGGYIDEIKNLLKKHKNRITEIGEANVESYPFKLKINDEIWKQYTFDTNDGNLYFCSFKVGFENDWTLNFGYHNPKKGVSYDFSTVTNKGKLFKIMSTIIKISNEFIKNFSPHSIKFKAKENFEGDTRRKKLYVAFLKKNIPLGYEITDNSEYVVIKKNKKTDEGVADKYAEKEFYMQPEFGDFEKKHNEKINRENREEIITGDYDGDKMNLIKNPKSLKNIGYNVRGLIDKEGNLYVEQKINTAHSSIIAFLKEKGLINYQSRWNYEVPREFVTVVRYGATHIFALGESNEQMTPTENRNDPRYEEYWKTVSDYDTSKQAFQMFLDRAKQKNPQIKFINRMIDYHNLEKNVDEGVADKYAEREFNIPDPNREKEIRTSAVIQKEMEKPFGYVIDESNDEKVAVYENPKSLNNFDNNVRAIIDSYGDMYVAQMDGDFHHHHMLELIGDYYKDVLTMHRIRNTDSFGASDSTVMNIIEKEISEEDAETILDKAKQKNPQYTYSLEYYESLEESIDLVFEGIMNKIKKC